MKISINTKNFEYPNAQRNYSYMTNIAQKTSALNFKGYYGDKQPIKKLFYIVSGKNSVYEDAWTKSRLYQVGLKKWINAHPADLLKRTPEQLIQSICTLIKPDNHQLLSL